MQTKHWECVEVRLKNPDQHSVYFAGGTLCVDLPKGGVAMNLNGKGFVYGGDNTFRKNSKVYLPNHIISLVRDLYIKTKGHTNHYKRNNNELITK